jgi:hypothetical protein
MMTLAKREATLRTLLIKHASDARLLKAAERVRCARMQVLRARIGEIPQFENTHEHDNRLTKLEKQIESLQATHPLAIVREFRNS